MSSTRRKPEAKWILVGEEILVHVGEDEVAEARVLEGALQTFVRFVSAAEANALKQDPAVTAFEGLFCQGMRGRMRKVLSDPDPRRRK